MPVSLNEMNLKLVHSQLGSRTVSEPEGWLHLVLARESQGCEHDGKIRCMFGTVTTDFMDTEGRTVGSVSI